MAIRSHATSAFVDDQTSALAFDTDKLGFVLKNGAPVGADRLTQIASSA